MEYALLISGIAAVIVVAIVLFGGFVDGIFTDSCKTLTSTHEAHGGPARSCN